MSHGRRRKRALVFGELTLNEAITARRKETLFVPSAHLILAFTSCGQEEPFIPTHLHRVALRLRYPSARHTSFGFSQLPHLRPGSISETEGSRVVQRRERRDVGAPRVSRTSHCSDLRLSSRALLHSPQRFLHSLLVIARCVSFSRPLSPLSISWPRSLPYASHMRPTDAAYSPDSCDGLFMCSLYINANTGVSKFPVPYQSLTLNLNPVPPTAAPGSVLGDGLLALGAAPWPEVPPPHLRRPPRCLVRLQSSGSRVEQPPVCGSLTTRKQGPSSAPLGCSTLDPALAKLGKWLVLIKTTERRAAAYGDPARSHRAAASGGKGHVVLRAAPRRPAHAQEGIVRAAFMPSRHCVDRVQLLTCCAAGLQFTLLPLCLPSFIPPSLFSIWPRGQGCTTRKEAHRSLWPRS
ncbi:unnamed protein product [Pleuronectes platessa]|uniref:Uncharacterized protein n=1 Tax=Pleuronectes platessa TaxID=8262 RepID=A0A9N7YDU6_PLEPL|nr:unnamed protein product [Pleuronectes platessa]